ncbi:hypothetical protein [Corynebacterium timonense]|uniref:EcsC protein family protein n=1 Tax=Corynebacterium timonense TaxID=441500 RepID=A0A1H1QCG7_9CORY|nr:hypothetical protein [Corynebacterium timonense]SDS20977.1 hypothetical protein SAMN04488539_1229 [Corynebacterium timonense]
MVFRFGTRSGPATAEGAETQRIITDALNSDAAALEEEAGPLGRALIAAVDKAAQLQSAPIRAYVEWVRRSHPEATPAQVQAIVDKHFRTAVSSTGAGVGAAAAVPGIGFVTGGVTVAGESVLFLDIAAFYTMASAHLRGVDITDPQRRRAVVLVALTGAKGVAVVDALLGDDTRGVPAAATLSRFSGPRLAEANSILTRVALRSLRKRLSRAWLGKILPLGIGVVAGVAANRKLAARIIDTVSPSLGPLPPRFLEALPAPAADEEGAAGHQGHAETGSRGFLRFVRKAAGKNRGKEPGQDAPRKGLMRR